MSEQIKSQISALVDDELSTAETELLLQRLSRDADLASTLTRYTLIGDAMRGPITAVLPQGFSGRVMRQVNREPADAPAVAEKARLWKTLQPAVGAAIAATVAVVAIVVLQRTPSEIPAVSVADGTDGPAYTVPGPEPLSPELRLRLNRKLFRHSQYASPVGRQQSWLNVMHEDTGDDTSTEDERSPVEPQE